jgi:hypothetical protein
MKKNLILGIFFLTMLFTSCNSQDESNAENVYTQDSLKNTSNTSSNKENMNTKNDKINTPYASFRRRKNYLNDKNDKIGDGNDEEIGHVGINGEFYMDQIVIVVKQKGYWVVKIKDEMPVKEKISNSQQFKNWIKTKKLSENLVASTYELKIIDDKNIRIHSFRFEIGTTVEVIDKKQNK